MPRPWLAYVDGEGSELFSLQDDKASRGEVWGSAVVSSCQPRTFSIWSLQADAPTWLGVQEPLGSVVPSLL